MANGHLHAASLSVIRNEIPLAAQIDDSQNSSGAALDHVRCAMMRAQHQKANLRVLRPNSAKVRKARQEANPTKVTFLDLACDHY